MINDHGKLIVLLLALAGSFAALLSHTGDAAFAQSTITAIIGYIFGNGVLAVRNKAPSPAIGAKDQTVTLTPTPIVDHRALLLAELATNPTPERTREILAELELLLKAAEPAPPPPKVAD